MMNETPDIDQYWQALETAALANSSLTEEVTAHTIGATWSSSRRTP